ncbi:MAG: hypothetical protein JNM77_00745 [Pseudonocardia sp.]|nr:hypothetical protein [Pseudonocardia sp.]
MRELLVHQMGSFGDAELVAEAALGAVRRTQDPAAAVRLLSAREIQVPRPGRRRIVRCE